MLGKFWSDSWGKMLIFAIGKQPFLLFAIGKQPVRGCNFGQKKSLHSQHHNNHHHQPVSFYVIKNDRLLATQKMKF